MYHHLEGLPNATMAPKPTHSNGEPIRADTAINALQLVETLKSVFEVLESVPGARLAIGPLGAMLRITTVCITALNIQHPRRKLKRGEKSLYGSTMPSNLCPKS